MADFPIFSLGAKKPVGPLGDASVEAVKRAAQRSPLVVAAASNTGRPGDKRTASQET